MTKVTQERKLNFRINCYVHFEILFPDCDKGMQCTTCMETFALDEEVAQLNCKVYN